MNTNREGGGIPCAEQFNVTDDPFTGVDDDGVSSTNSGASTNM